MDKLTKVLTQSETLNTKYDDLSKTNFQDNSKITTELIASLNKNLSELNFIQNEMNLLSNLNQESLLKKEELLKMRNEELMEQLRSLEVLQSSIRNKDRLIEQTNENIDKQNLNIYVLALLGGLSTTLFILINLKGYNIISQSRFNMMLAIHIILFVLTVSYSYNTFYFKDAITYLFDRSSLRLANQLKKMSEEKSSTSDAESDWISENCNCPVEETIDNGSYPADQNMTQREHTGHFYYDGSAPQQIIVDLPLEEGKYDQNIDWVDYAQGGKPMYNPKNNKTTYTNKQYYNYNETSDPSIMLSHVLEETRVLVDNKTYTANI
jgi:hypothetical protein